MLLWFVLGPGGLSGSPRSPRKVQRIAQGDLPGASRGPGARVKKPTNLYLLQGPIERPSLPEALSANRDPPRRNAEAISKQLHFVVIFRPSPEATATQTRVLAICNQGLGRAKIRRYLESKRAPIIDDFRLRLKPWLQMARTLVSVAVA